MKKIIVLVLLLCLQSVWAQAADLKIGVFSLEDVIAQCDAHKEKTRKIEQEFAPRQKQIKNLEAEIKDRYAQYRNASATMKPASKSALSAELVRASRDFDAKNGELQNSVYEAEERAYGEVRAIIDMAAGEIGKKGGYSLLVDKETLRAYYMAATMDVTDVMIKEVNRIWKEKPTGIK